MGAALAMGAFFSYFSHVFQGESPYNPEFPLSLEGGSEKKWTYQDHGKFFEKAKAYPYQGKSHHNPSSSPNSLPPTGRPYHRSSTFTRYAMLYLFLSPILALGQENRLPQDQVAPQNLGHNPQNSTHHTRFIPVKNSTLSTLKPAGIFQRLSDKITLKKSRTVLHGQNIPKENISLVIIKGGTIDVELEGKETAKFDVNITGKVMVNKRKTCLIIEGDDQGKIHGKIVLPHGVGMIFEGGHVSVRLHDIIGEVDIRGGTVNLSGGGKISRLNMRAGVAKMNVEGIMGNTTIDCGQGALQLAYISESFEKIEDVMTPAGEEQSYGSRGEARRGKTREENPYRASGLRLRPPAVKIYLHLAQGQGILFFPKNTGITYPKENKSVESFVPHQSKRGAFRIFPYLVPTASSLVLRATGDK